jgi:RHS repeat-associated protein
MNYPQSGQYAFATYLDNGSGVYYADQRWYAAAPGRFLSPDPYKNSGGPADPQSWNHFMYVLGDPINLYDPMGLYYCDPDMNCDPGPPDPCNPPPGQIPAVACQVPPQVPPPPTCGDMLPPWFQTDPINIMVQRVLNENSFFSLGAPSYQAGDKPFHPTGPTITWGTLSAEDLALASVIVNLSKTPNSGFGSLYAAARQNGDFSNEEKILNPNTLDGDYLSNDCTDILEAMTAVESVLYYGSQLPMYYNNWRGALQQTNGTFIVRSPAACQFQIDDTMFINYKNLTPCTL